MIINEHEHIGIRIIDSRFDTISNFGENFRDVFDHVIGKIQTSSEDPFNLEYPFLTSIDEHDNTFYNWYQVSKLINELERLANKDEDSDFKDAVANVVKYMMTVKHATYIQLVGD